MFPPQRKEGQSDKQYDAICRFGKQVHDSQRGQVDVKKLLSVASLDLAHLFRIKHILQDKGGISASPSMKSNMATEIRSIDIEGAVKALAGYISGVSAADFKHIIRHHSLPVGANRAKWCGSYTDAWRFQERLSWGIKAFNSVFEIKQGRQLHSNDKDKNGVSDSFGICMLLKSLGIAQ